MNTQRRQEALLNEYKGSIFEYLVAANLSRLHGLEKSFLESLTDLNFKHLSQKESFIRNYKENLLTDLQSFAHKTSLEINSFIDKKIDKVEVVGKANASEKNAYSESDIKVLASEEYHFSLKLNKANAFVNTKSMGVKSFLDKYFGKHELQKDFNSYFDMHFEIFSRDIHDLHDIKYDSKFVEWQKSQLPVLPGQLVKGRDLLLNFYSLINTRIHDIIVQLNKTDHQQFQNCLKALYGFSDKKIIQVICFHQGQKAEVFLNHDHDILLKTIKKNKTNIELVSDSKILQLRLKPMNTFINPAYKINCSLKPK